MDALNRAYDVESTCWARACGVSTASDSVCERPDAQSEHLPNLNLRATILRTPTGQVAVIPNKNVQSPLVATKAEAPPR